MNPHTTSNAARMNPAITWNACGRDHRRPAFQAGQGPEQREHDRGDGKPAPQPDPRQPERRGGDDREIEVQRPEIGLVGRNQKRRDEGGGDAEAGQRRPVQQGRGERAQRHHPEQNERGRGREKIVQRVGGVDRGEGNRCSGGGEDRREYWRSAALRSRKRSPCGGSIRRRPAAPARTRRRAGCARRGRAGPPRSNSAP